MHAGDPRGDLLGVEHRGGQRLAQGGVHLGRHAAQPLGLAGEVGADVGRMQVGLDEQVAHAGLRGLPALGAADEELLQERQHTGVAVRPAERRRDVLAADLLQRQVHLDVRVHPGRDLAVDLERHRVAVRERGVGLLAGQHQARAVQHDRRTRAVEGDAVDGGLLGHEPRPQPGHLAVVQGVVAGPGADPRVLQPGDRLGPVLDVHLVARDVAADRSGRHEQDGDDGVVLQPRELPDLDHLDLAAATGEPPLPGQELGEVLGGGQVLLGAAGRPGVAAHGPASLSGSTRNQ